MVIKFKNVGRNHVDTECEIPDYVWNQDADRTAYLMARAVRPFVRSVDVEFSEDGESGHGTVWAGWHAIGTWEIEREQAKMANA